MSKENSELELVMLRLEYDISKLKQFIYAAEQSEQEASEIIAELKAENAKLKEKYQEELTVNTQLQEWQDEDLRQIAQLKKDLDLFRKAHDNEQAQRRIFEQKLEKIKEFVTPLCCNNPLDCWMNKDEGTGDIYGCEGDDYKGCPNGFASCILKIIEGVEDE